MKIFQLTLTKAMTVFNSHVFHSSNWIRIQNSLILRIVIDTEPWWVLWWCCPNTQRTRSTTILIRIASTPIVALARPSPFKTIFWFIPTMTFTWPFKTWKRISFRAANGKAHLNSHIFACFIIFRQNPISPIISCANSIQFWIKFTVVSADFFDK